MPSQRTINEVRGLPPGRDYLVSKFKFQNLYSPYISTWVVDEIFAGQGYYQPTIDVSQMDSGSIELSFGTDPNQLPYMCHFLATGDESIPSGFVGPFSFYTGANSFASGSSGTITNVDEGYFVWNFNEEESYVGCADAPGGQWVFSMQNADMLSDGVGQCEIEIRFNPKLALDIELSL